MAVIVAGNRTVGKKKIEKPRCRMVADSPSAIMEGTPTYRKTVSKPALLETP